MTDPLAGLRPHEAQNRRSWNAYSDEYQSRHGAQLAPTTALTWGTEPGDRLVHDYFGLHVVEDDGEMVFNLGYGDWIRLFRANGFIVEDLIEPRPPEGAPSSYRSAVAHAWSRRWPGESIWRLRKA